MRGVVGSGTGDNGGPVTDRIHHRPQQVRLLRFGGGRRFAGGTGDREQVDTPLDQTVRKGDAGVYVELALGAEGGHHRDTYRAGRAQHRRHRFTVRHGQKGYPVTGQPSTPSSVFWAAGASGDITPASPW